MTDKNFAIGLVFFICIIGSIANVFISDSLLSITPYVTAFFAFLTIVHITNNINKNID